jgi:hypothetical protein
VQFEEPRLPWNGKLWLEFISDRAGRGWNRIALRQILAYEHSDGALEKVGRPGR